MDPIFSWRFAVSRAIGFAVAAVVFSIIGWNNYAGLLAATVALLTVLHVTHRWDRYGWPEFRWFRRR
jgi:inner membrane protein involved in colicin E2 resistance